MKDYGHIDNNSETPRTGLGTDPEWLEFSAHVQQAGLTLRQEIVAELVRGGFNAGRWPILLYLKRESDAVRQIDLANALNVDRLMLGNVLHEAEADGFIVRDYDPHDRRVKLVGLTDAGRRRADEVEAVVGQICDRFSTRVSAEEAAICLRVLREVCDAIKK